MEVAAKQPRKTIQEFYRIENDATEKHEFRNGEILAMSGGSPRHALIAANTIWQLRQRLMGKPCIPYGSDLRIRMTGRERTAYPDVSIICGPIQYDPDDKAKHTVLNPRVIVELLSETTEAYDRGDKFAAYRDVPSLEEYVLVSQSEPRIETFVKQTDGSWRLSFFKGIDGTGIIQSIGVELPLAQVYADVDFSSDVPELPT